MPRITFSLLAVAAATVALSTGASPAAASSSKPAVLALSLHGSSPAGGTEIMITGRHLDGLTSVHFGSAVVKEREHAGGHIFVTVPAHQPGVVHVRIVTNHGRSARSAAAEFDYFRPASGGALTWSGPKELPETQGGVIFPSCASSTFCAATDGQGNITYFNGKTWTRAHKIDDTDINFNELSCPTSTFCMVVDQKGRVLTYDGTKWTKPQQSLHMKPYPILSCGSATFCLVTSGTDQYRFYNGSSWTPLASVPDLPDGTQVQSFSCAAARCVLGTNAHGDQPAHLLSFDGSTWTDLGAYPAPPDDMGNLPWVSALSCSGDFCGIFDSADQVSTLQGTSVTHTYQVSGDDLSEPLRLSCPIDNFCGLVNEDDDSTALFTVDRDGLHRVKGQPLNDDYETLACGSPKLCIVGGWSAVWTYRGGSLSKPRPLLPGGGLADFSCVSRTFCMTTEGDGTAAVFNGKRFGPAVTAVAAPTGPSFVSCATRSFCVFGAGSSVAMYQGGKWRHQHAIDVHRLTGVSCGSTQLCAAVDNSGRVSLYRGHGWTGPRRIDGTRKLISVSCAGSSVCAVLDRTGGVLVYRNGQWTARHREFTSKDSYSQYSNISCGSADLCIAADDDGSVGRYNGKRWLAPVGISDDLTDVSCASSSFCLVPGTYTFNGMAWSVEHKLPRSRQDIYQLSCTSRSWCLASGTAGGYFIGRS